MTDEERRAKRRYHAGFVFETMPEAALTFDEVEAAGLDGTLRQIGE